MSKKALIAMSGGVDSSIAAKLMKDAGYECIGCTMKLYDNEDVGISKGHTCCSLDDVEDARNVAAANGMPYYVLNFKDGFSECVVRRFVDAYENGRTPNPCIDCNRFMKFDKLFYKAKELGCDYVVTGHYARIEQSGDKYILKKGLDDTKDQSYVLYSMTQEQLKHTLFPIGNLRKTEVREIAEANSFINANKPDSQDICFVPDGDYATFIKRHTGKDYRHGKFIDLEGNVLGEHKGIINYTIGQRKGLGIAYKEPLYVVDIRPDENVVILGNDKALFSTTFEAGDFNWISSEVPKGEIECRVKVRYRQKEQPARVIPLNDNKVRIEFRFPPRAITKGQAAVLYDGDVVLGGGTIL
ncbi:MAG: tRNA 2-thiouridine(34) synthase MnmA [Lachnospiraceae bacterium]|nr:tRNA 2-thiouridine(34) synthase MnmA [Lachnospiraceae bacterium]